MDSIVIGYKNADGSGPVSVVSGPEMGQTEQIELVNKAKHGGEFPPGILRLDFVVVDVRITALDQKPKSKSLK